MRDLDPRHLPEKNQVFATLRSALLIMPGRDPRKHHSAGSRGSRFVQDNGVSFYLGNRAVIRMRMAHGDHTGLCLGRTVPDGSIERVSQERMGALSIDL